MCCFIYINIPVSKSIQGYAPAPPTPIDVHCSYSGPEVGVKIEGADGRVSRDGGISNGASVSLGVSFCVKGTVPIVIGVIRTGLTWGPVVWPSIFTTYSIVMI